MLNPVSYQFDWSRRYSYGLKTIRNIHVNIKIFPDKKSGSSREGKLHISVLVNVLTFSMYNSATDLDHGISYSCGTNHKLFLNDPKESTTGLYLLFFNEINVYSSYFIYSLKTCYLTIQFFSNLVIDVYHWNRFENLEPKSGPCVITSEWIKFWARICQS